MSFAHHWRQFRANKAQQFAVAVNMLTFFLGWLVVFFLGADFPPPAGFIAIPILLLPLTALLGAYSVLLVQALMAQSPHLFWRHLLTWVVASTIVGFMLSLLPGGEPSMPAPTPAQARLNRLILTGVVAGGGLFNGIAHYVLNLWLVRRLLPKRQGPRP